VERVVELGIPELTSEQIEEACATAENAARKHIFSQISQKQADTLNISVEAEGTKPVNFTVEVNLELTPQTQGVSQKKLAEEAVQQAFKAIENYLRKLT